jgi:hypothetical protein
MKYRSQALVLAAYSQRLQIELSSPAGCGRGMSKYFVLLPVLNRKVQTFGGPVWYLTPNAAFRTISEAHFSAAHKHGKGLNNDIGIGTKCIQFDGFDDNPSDPELKKLLLCSSYVLTYFSRDRPPSFRIAVIYSEHSSGRSKVHRVYDVPESLSGAILQPDLFKLRAACKAEDLAALYKVCTGALLRHPPLETTIERYFSGRAKKMFQEKVIDTAIALETMIPGSTELRYRFSLYHSILSSDIDARADAFKTFQMLYDVRSSIVHGDIQKVADKIQQLGENWSKVSELMDKSLFYYFVFLKQKGPAEWGKHVERLALGYNEKISSEEIPQ